MTAASGPLAPDTPSLQGILETVLYTDDLDRAAAFYETVMGLTPTAADSRFRAFAVAGRGMLLVFRRGATREPVHLPGGSIPPHDGAGPLHMAFAVATADLPAWADRLAAHGIAIESRMDWPQGGKSIYFRDPDGHCLELASRGIWPGVWPAPGTDPSPEA